MQHVPQLSYGRVMCDDGDLNSFLLTYLFNDQAVAIEFLQYVGSFGDRCRVTPAVKIGRSPRITVFVKDSVFDVKRGLLGPGVISLRPSITGHGSSGVISLSWKF